MNENDESFNVKGSKQPSDMSHDEICRLRFQPVIITEARSLQEVPADCLHTLTPKIDFAVTRDPSIKNSDVEEKMGENESEICDVPFTEVCIKTEEIDIKKEETSEEEMPMKFFYVGVKQEEYEEGDIPLYPTNSSTGTETEIKHDIQEEPDKNGENRNRQSKQKGSSKTRVYKCYSCKYETKTRTCLVRHQLCHRDPSQLQMYKCDTCGHETKYKSKLIRHQLIHKSPSEVKMYKCDECQFETKHKTSLLNHQLTHKDPSEVQMYKCDKCKFETKKKYQLKLHQLRHRDPSPTPVYKCNECEFETKRSDVLKRHLLSHDIPRRLKLTSDILVRMKQKMSSILSSTS